MTVNITKTGHISATQNKPEELSDTDLNVVEGGILSKDQTVSERHDTAKAVIGKNAKEFAQSGGDPTF